MIEAGRLLDAATAAGSGYREALHAGSDQSRAWFATMLGRAELLLGRTESAVRSAREAASIYRTAGQFGMARLGLTGLIISLAHLGRLEEAEERLAELDGLGSPDAELFGAETYRARTWVAVARDRLDEATTHLRQGVEAARGSGEHVVEAAALHDLARIGAAEQAADRLGDLAGVIEGTLTAARAAHAAALAEDDADKLLAVAGAFEAMAATIFAAEAWAAAAESFGRVGNARRSVAARRRAVILAGRCEGTRTPGLARAGEEGALSDREREVVSLAAQNLTDRQIADRLYLSVRTVNNHLQRVYTKLGISSRSELARALDELER
jgi:DNA-binding CsgD family transcriptional regulator